MGESPAQFCLIIQHCLRRQASKYLGCSKSLISPDGSRSTFSNASVNLFYLENQRPNGLEENCVWCSYPCQSRQVSCGGCAACQSTSICLWWKTQMVAVLQNNETGHNSKGKDILKIMPFFIATEDLVNLHFNEEKNVQKWPCFSHSTCRNMLEPNNRRSMKKCKLL